MGVVSWRELDRYFADAYCKAALAGAEMRAASNTIETLRDAVLAIPAGKSVMEAWAAFDEQIGLADLNQLVPVLVNLRQEFIKIATEREIYRLLRASEREPEAGWVNWVETYARALSPWGWRTTFGNDIARDGLKGRTLFKDWPIKRIRDATELVKKSRWSETYDWFIFLAEEDIQPELRAHLLSIAAEIQLYHFYQPSKTKELLELADRLAPSGVCKLCGESTGCIRKIWSVPGAASSKSSSRCRISQMVISTWGIITIKKLNTLEPKTCTNRLS
jgi:hypothetical protein